MNASPIVNIAAALVQRARDQAETTALILQCVNDLARDPDERVTFARLNEDSDRLARGLLQLGLSRGMRTVLMVPPSYEFFAVTFALFKLGAVIVLIDPGMGINNLGICLAEAEPEAFIGVTKAQIARILLGWGKKTIRYRVTAGWRGFWSDRSLQSVWKAGEQGDPVLADTRADEMAAILFTSGSTGVAKGAVYTHGIFAAQVEYLKTIYRIEPGEIDLPTFPLFGLFAPALGMTAVIPEMDFTRPGRVSPDNILRPIHEYGVTNLFGSPALLRRVSQSRQAKRVKLATLRRVISAGAPVSPEVIRKMVEMLQPGVQVHTPYGATESLPVATIGSDEILGETGALTSQGKGVCVGRPVEGMQVRILKISEDPVPVWREELELPEGTIGEIVVSGPVVTRSYYNRPDMTALHKINDPARNTFWHRMGDVGYLDERGRIWFCGRKAHRVVTAGGTYFTIPCEGVFNAHPAVYRTALVGVDRGQGIEPELCVEIDPDLARRQRPDRDQAILQSFCGELKELGSRFDHTRAIRRFHIHPAFPVDIRHNAKIFREKLAVWAATQTGEMP